MLQKYRRVTQLMAIVIFAGLLTACAPSNELSPESENALRERVIERWQFMIAGDYEAAWEYSTPNYRSVFSKQLFVKQFSNTLDRELTGVEVLAYDGAAAVASVAVRVMSKPTKQTSSASAALGALPVTIKEQWILIDGVWWYSVKA